MNSTVRKSSRKRHVSITTHTYSLSEVRKAVVGAGVTTLAALGAAMLDGDLTKVEAFASIGMGLVSFGAVFKTSNDKVKVSV